MKRLALIATPTLEPNQRPAPGALDGDLVRSRLPLDDTRFRVVDLDPAVDLAEQIDGILEQEAPGSEDTVVLYASGSAALSEAGEFFLCLDPANPDTGDAIADVAAVFRDRASGPVLFVLECRHMPDAEDPFRSATVVAAAKDALKSVAPGIGLLIGARPTSDRTEEVPSPFTRAVVETIDDVDPAEGITAEALYARVRESEALVGVVPGFGFVRGALPLAIVPPQRREPPSTPQPAPGPSSANAPGTPAPAVAPSVDVEGDAPRESAAGPVEAPALAVAEHAPVLPAGSPPDPVVADAHVDPAPPPVAEPPPVVIVAAPDPRASSDDIQVDIGPPEPPPSTRPTWRWRPNGFCCQCRLNRSRFYRGKIVLRHLSPARLQRFRC